LKGKNFFIFFYLPFLGIVIIFFVFSSLNRAHIRNKVEELVKEQIQATSGILKTDMAHFLGEGYSVDDIFGLYSREKNIYYMALLDANKEVLAWNSRFEGYLPLSVYTAEKKESWIIDSPVGRIFNFFSTFSTKDSKTYFLYIGYSLNDLEEMIAHSQKNFFIIFVLLCIAGVIFFIGLFLLQSRYLAKKREVAEHKEEEERYREISAFTSGVAHEIRNPLNSLSLLFETLHKKVPQDLKEETSLGKMEIQKIVKIIDQFSASLKPFELNKKKFLFKALIMEVWNSIEKEKRKNEVNFFYSQDSSVELYADVGLIKQALYNLLRNALEASDAGPIFVHAANYKKKVKITIQDKGKGIQKQDREKIFEPFFSRKKDGMGIGLYITKKIVEAHEGKIQVESSPGEGTDFSIII